MLSSLFAVSALFFTSSDGAETRQKLILDADTANEIDDMYAIVRMLKQDDFEVVGLSSAQWFHYLSGERSVFASQVYNEDLLRLLHRQDLPAPLGADEAIGKPWGGSEPKDSPAARFIIEQARALPEGEKLLVVSIGAATNLASAIGLAPEIVPRISAYVLGFHCDPETGVWNKSEFNIRRDLNAADLLLNTEGLELHVMPVSVAKVLTFDRDETFSRHEQMGELGAYLTGKWKARFADSKSWIMWDLALVQAILHPEMASERGATTPPENTQRTVQVYDKIDPEAMRAEYWATALQK
ncbi:MAG: nucleoside hydrolase [Verrucomicrobiae bacterium]|nr:nucleoside hydrolase [Verrucomicrobiae bacterium]